MKKVNMTLKLSFEIEDTDKETIKDALYLYLEDQINSDELFTEDSKYTVIDTEDEDEELEEDEDQGSIFSLEFNGFYKSVF